MNTKVTITRSDNDKYIVHVDGFLHLANNDRVPKTEIHCFDTLREVFVLADRLLKKD